MPKIEVLDQHMQGQLSNLLHYQLDFNSPTGLNLPNSIEEEISIWIHVEARVGQHDLLLHTKKWKQIGIFQTGPVRLKTGQLDRLVTELDRFGTKTGRFGN